MIKRVLVPLDGSRLAEAALEPAVKLLEPVQGTLILLHAVTPAESFAMSASEFVGRQRRRARTYLDRLSSRLEDGRIGVRPRVVTGEASTAIVSTARGEDADLIALSSHGRSGVREWAFGSVAERVLRTASRPVLVFRGRAPFRVRRILLAVDESGPSLSILPVVMDVARGLEAEVRILHAGTRLPATVDRAIRALGRGGVPFRTRLSGGPAAKAILDAAREDEADVLAITTSGKTRQDRLFFGSVAEEVLRRAERPVLVMRGRAAG
jgi:nucleotide-binding universal stress UspA family protein